MNRLRQVVQIDRDVLVSFITEIKFIILDVERIVVLQLHEHFVASFDVRIFKVISLSAVYVIVISFNECLSLLLGSVAYDELVLFKVRNRILCFLFVCLRIVQRFLRCGVVGQSPVVCLLCQSIFFLRVRHDFVLLCELIFQIGFFIVLVSKNAFRIQIVGLSRFQFGFCFLQFGFCFVKSVVFIRILGFMICFFFLTEDFLFFGNVLLRLLRFFACLVGFRLCIFISLLCVVLGILLVSQRFFSICFVLLCFFEFLRCILCRIDVLLCLVDFVLSIVCFLLSICDVIFLIGDVLICFVCFLLSIRNVILLVFDVLICIGNVLTCLVGIFLRGFVLVLFSLVQIVLFLRNVVFLVFDVLICVCDVLICLVVFFLSIVCFLLSLLFIVFGIIEFRLGCFFLLFRCLSLDLNLLFIGFVRM